MTLRRSASRSTPRSRRTCYPTHLSFHASTRSAFPSTRAGAFCCFEKRSRIGLARPPAALPFDLPPSPIDLDPLKTVAFTDDYGSLVTYASTNETFDAIDNGAVVVDLSDYGHVRVCGENLVRSGFFSLICSFHLIIIQRVFSINFVKPNSCNITCCSFRGTNSTQLHLEDKVIPMGWGVDTGLLHDTPTSLTRGPAKANTRAKPSNPVKPVARTKSPNLVRIISTSIKYKDIISY